MNGHSADNNDNASVEEERHLKLALSIRKKVLPKTGYCYNCEDPVEHTFCDIDCKTDWEKRHRG